MLCAQAIQQCDEIAPLSQAELCKAFLCESQARVGDEAGVVAVRILLEQLLQSRLLSPRALHELASVVAISEGRYL